MDDVTSSDDLRRAWESIGSGRRASARVRLGRMGLVTVN